ncbi:MAG: hypothetical protein ACREOJ_05135 [Gemmatimonadaceae bacterium]
MQHIQGFAIEATAGTATLYLFGPVSGPQVLEAMRQCGALPDSVWLLRVDSHSAPALDQGAVRVLAHALRGWREERSGCTIYTLPLRAPAPRAPGADWMSRRMRLRDAAPIAP